MFPIIIPGGRGGGCNCDATDSCNEAATIAVIVIACVLAGIVLLCCCYICACVCLSEYEDRVWRNRRVDDQLPEVVPVVEHVVNVEPPPAVSFYIESAEQLQPVQDGERIAIVVD